MFVYQRVHHVIHALEDRFPAWRSEKPLRGMALWTSKLVPGCQQSLGIPAFFFSMYMSTWHRVLPHHRKTEKPRNTYGIGISTWIYIYDIRYRIYAIHIYICYIYICLLCVSARGGSALQDFLVLLAWLSSSDSAWIFEVLYLTNACL